MLLEQINDPADLRGLTYEELDALAGEIRDVIVEAVAENAGHLGSNLGAVELSLALHRVFESPTDAILWDTGHQAYVHKILTGRRKQFAQLRQAGGMSGYPSREESRHDFVENSHASTILSYAYGMAVARDAGVDAPPPHRRRDRRRCDDGRHGVRGAQQPRPQQAPRHHRAQRQRPQLRADGVEPVGQLAGPRRAGRPSQPARPRHRQAVERAHRHPSQPGLRAPPAPARGLPAAPARRRPTRRAGDGGVQGRRARVPPAALVLRGARRPLHRPDRRSQHRRARGGAAQRRGAVGRGTDRRPRAHAEGPRLPARRGRRREAPPRRAGVRPPARPAQGRADRLHAGVRRGRDQGRRARPADRRHHRRHARARRD